MGKSLHKVDFFDYRCSILDGKIDTSLNCLVIWLNYINSSENFTKADVRVSGK